MELNFADRHLDVRWGGHGPGVIAVHLASAYGRTYCGSGKQKLTMVISHIIGDKSIANSMWQVSLRQAWRIVDEEYSRHNRGRA
jgi:hypothetical protein